MHTEDQEHQHLGFGILSMLQYFYPVCNSADLRILGILLSTPMKEMKMFATILTGSLVPPPPPPGPMVRQQNPPSPSQNLTPIFWWVKSRPPCRSQNHGLAQVMSPLISVRARTFVTWKWKTQRKHHISEMSHKMNSTHNWKEMHLILNTQSLRHFVWLNFWGWGEGVKAVQRKYFSSRNSSIF